MASRFICVINRNRDSYQVPLALEQAGLLETFVTDYYAPDKAPKWVPAPLARRRIAGLPRHKTSQSRLSFITQYMAELFRLPMSRVFTLSDAFLGAKAGALARRTHQAIYAYHAYIPAELPVDVPLVVFAFHPMDGMEREILAADGLLFPEAAVALQREGSIGPRKPVDWGRSTAVVCASSFTAQSLVDEGCDPAKITIIPYGLPLVERLKEQPHRTGKGAQFLFAGQGIARKGLHHLIRAWQAEPPENAHLTIVSYRIEPEIAALIDHPSISLLGYLSRDDLDRQMEGADIFVMPSLIEGFGLVYLEALSRGCHVIGTSNSGLPDLALGEDAVSLVEAGDLAALSECLKTAAEHALAGGYDRAKISAAASVWTQAHFRQKIADHAAAVLASAG